jgi:uncharacterized protein involved in exopolysaccharide biosynthesis
MEDAGWQRLRDVVRRRRAPILFAGGLALAAGLAVTVALPSTFRAQAVVRALESQPAHDYVAPTVAEQAGERLKTLRLGLMARPLVGAVVDELELTPVLGRDRAAAVDAVRGKLEVKVEGEDTFLVSYEDTDPRRARLVVDRLAARFVDRAVELRRQVAAATARALSDEVAALAPQLARLDGALRDYKLQNDGSLPEQREENLRSLDQATLEVDIQSTTLDLQHERRRQLLTQAASPLRHQEDLLTSALHDARTRYTDEHPEVRRIDAELERVHAQRLADEEELRSDMQSRSPELAELDAEIRRTAALIAGLRGRQELLRARLAKTARVADEVARLSTEWEVVRGKYQAAIGKLHEAELSSAVERGLSALRWQLVEGPAEPRAASHPNRPVWAAGALALALLFGLAIGFALDLSDTSIRAPEDVAAATVGRPLPVLACIPDGAGKERKDE